MFDSYFSSGAYERRRGAAVGDKRMVRSGREVGRGGVSRVRQAGGELVLRASSTDVLAWVMDQNL